MLRHSIKGMGALVAALMVAHPVPAFANPAGTNVVISEIQSRAANVDNSIANAVELFNPTSDPIPLQGWVVEFYNSSDSVTATAFFSGIEIPARGFVVVTDPAYQPVPIKPGTPQVTYSGWADDPLPDLGGVLLLSDDLTRVDGVATIGVTPVEGGPADALTAATDLILGSIQRDIWMSDTDNNSADFSIRTAAWGD